MMKKIYRTFCVAALILFSCIVTHAQRRQVSGTVKNETGGVMPGVTILLKGTTMGVTTDTDGKFAIQAMPEDVLKISFIGYLSEQIPVGNKTQFNITIQPDIATLSEVVVIGYGEAKRKDVTGSISSVSGVELRKTNPVTIDQALQGKVAGMVVQQVSGQPGGGVSVQIRGISSFGGGGPLYVIDGVIIGGTATMGAGTNPLAAINPSEIESVDVLKDASATAIYGSQATNGVIIVTTKRGAVTPPRISYDFYTGFQQVPKRIPIMNLQEYATFINERNAGLGWGFDKRPEFANPQYLGKGTDWQKELFKNAPMTNHTVTINGGDARTQYLFSGSYFKQEGIATGSDFRRVSVRINLDNKTTNWLKIGTSLQLANIKENVNSTSSNVINAALSQTPDIAVRTADGSWGGAYNPNGWVNSTINPLAIATINKDQANRNQLFGNAYAEIAVSKSLTLRNEVTGSFSMATEDRFNPTYTMGLVKNTSNSGSYNVMVKTFIQRSEIISLIRIPSTNATTPMSWWDTRRN
jgi:TonB-linked SusC/RagA family outer membrane protein